MGSRKHVSVMSPAELRTLKWAILQLNEKRLHAFNVHLMQRMHQKGVSRKDVSRVILEGDIIEAHNKIEGDIRILLRMSTTRGYAVCVVVSLGSAKVITAYTNDDDDDHSSLDWSEYQWDTDLVSEVNAFMKRRKGSKPTSKYSER